MGALNTIIVITLRGRGWSQLGQQTGWEVYKTILILLLICPRVGMLPKWRGTTILRASSNIFQGLTNRRSMRITVHSTRMQGLYLRRGSCWIVGGSDRLKIWYILSFHWRRLRCPIIESHLKIMMILGSSGRGSWAESVNFSCKVEYDLI